MVTSKRYERRVEVEAIQITSESIGHLPDWLGHPYVVEIQGRTFTIRMGYGGHVIGSGGTYSGMYLCRGDGELACFSATQFEELYSPVTEAEGSGADSDTSGLEAGS